MGCTTLLAPKGHRPTIEDWQAPVSWTLRLNQPTDFGLILTSRERKYGSWSSSSRAMIGLPTQSWTDTSAQSEVLLSAAQPWLIVFCSLNASRPWCLFGTHIQLFSLRDEPQFEKRRGEVSKRVASTYLGTAEWISRYGLGTTSHCSVCNAMLPALSYDREEPTPALLALSPGSRMVKLERRLTLRLMADPSSWDSEIDHPGQGDDL